MKFLFELLISLILHPLAFILALVNISGRRDLSSLEKLVWAVVCIFWGIGPILYILIGGGELW